jgi:hypothetical protein
MHFSNTLNVNGLNSPSKGTGSINKTQLLIVYRKCTSVTKKASNRMEKDFIRENKAKKKQK